MNQIQQMFALQKQLNSSTNGAEWTNGTTQEGRVISWYRCIYMEAAEAIDSFNWKHWKDINAEPDWENVRVELVDIWHFIMSEAIRLNDTDYPDKYLKNPVRSADAVALVELLEGILLCAARENTAPSEQGIRQITDLFFDAISHIGMDIEELYKRYVVKNQLNIFRQKHGYKQGTYAKVWDAVEDNVIAFNIMDEHPEFTPEQLYAKLEKEYRRVNSS